MSTHLLPGDAAPWFHAMALGGNPRYAFNTAAGRPILMLLLGSAGGPAGAAALGILARYRAVFDDERASFFGVSVDPADVAEARIAPVLPGIRWFVDGEGAVSRMFGAADAEGHPLQGYRAQWLVLDRTLRVVSRHPIEAGEQAMASLAAVAAEQEDEPAPVLVVPRVLEPALCRRLIDLYRAQGGVDSGFMREENGLTVSRTNHDHKRRADCHVKDPAMQAALSARLRRFLLPAIQRAFQFEATRIERWLVACYDGASGGHFRAHRDNTTKGTAHRRFAVTINLNAEDYDGGDLCFPEFGRRTYRAPTGGAVVFSCSLLHEARPVTRGERFAFLPFLYDEAGATIREANARFLSPELGSYVAAPLDAADVISPRRAG